MDAMIPALPPTAVAGPLGDEMANDLPSSPAPSSTESGVFPSTGSGSGSTAEDGVELSPPQSHCDQSEAEVVLEGRGRSGRALFFLKVSMPDGKIVVSRMLREGFQSDDLIVGRSFFKALHGNCQSFFLSAAITTAKQRLFSRIRSGRMSHACELLCEFDQAASVARVSGYALRSAYEPSAGPLAPFAFMTKHASTCALTHIDLSCIPYLGHLPTDLIGRSLLAFVYAPDVHVIRQAHLDLHAARGRIVRSQAPIRFVAYNGALVRAETEWSGYVNPWTKKIELVVARHRLVDAPVGDANVLGVPPEGYSSPVLPTSLVRILEEELRQILARPVGHGRGAVGAVAPLAGLPIGAPKDLASYIDRLVEGFVMHGPNAPLEAIVKKLAEPANANTDTATPSSVADQPTVNSSALAPLPLPLSYNQINCLENVHRLLKSQSRKDEAAKESAMDASQLAPCAPLTREMLQEHTRRFENEYRATWSRRLSGALGLKRPLSLEPLPTTSQPPAGQEVAPPPAKQAKASTAAWTPAQREEYYRSLPPNPAPPPGHNFQITSMPLPSASAIQQAASSPRRSAFSAPARPLQFDQQKSYGPLSITTFDLPVSVIKTTEQQGATLLLEAPRLP